MLERGFLDNLSLYKRKLDEAIPVKPEFDKIRASQSEFWLDVKISSLCKFVSGTECNTRFDSES